ncbi:hypothetical protein [Helicobacter canis]|uniref:hypothetical protein n=1 Tax=Helicobacter canis TaxID=29419 RepID=UPI000E0FE998|nr:hypothetical protein [Helicobacter canis]
MIAILIDEPLCVGICAYYTPLARLHHSDFSKDLLEFFYNGWIFCPPRFYLQILLCKRKELDFT